MISIKDTIQLTWSGHYCWLASVFEVRDFGMWFSNGSLLSPGSLQYLIHQSPKRFSAIPSFKTMAAGYRPPFRVVSPSDHGAWTFCCAHTSSLEQKKIAMKSGECRYHYCQENRISIFYDGFSQAISQLQLRCLPGSLPLPNLLSPRVVLHSKFQGLSYRFSHQMTGRSRLSARTHRTYIKSHSTRRHSWFESKCALLSLVFFPVVLFLTWTPLSPPSDTDHQFANYLIPASFPMLGSLPNSIDLPPPPEFHVLISSTVTSNLSGWKFGSLLLIIFSPFTTPLIAMTLWFFDLLSVNTKTFNSTDFSCSTIVPLVISAFTTKIGCFTHRKPRSWDVKPRLVIISNFCQTVDLPARISDRLNDWAQFVDPIHTFVPSFFDITSLFPLGPSDHSLNSFSTFFSQSQYPVLDTSFSAISSPIGIVFVNFWLVILKAFITLYLVFLCLSLSSLRLFFKAYILMFRISPDPINHNPLSGLITFATNLENLCSAHLSKLLEIALCKLGINARSP